MVSPCYGVIRTKSILQSIYSRGIHFHVKYSADQLRKIYEEGKSLYESKFLISFNLFRLGKFPVL